MRKQTEKRTIQTSSNRRTDERMLVDWAGLVTLENDTSVSCVILDVSLAGVQIESDADVAIGDELVLFIPSVGSFAGTVRWLAGRRKGISLEAGPDLLLKRIAEDGDNYPDLAPKDAR
ncbi:MAG TPA: PilZ domain-containing protein [Alphaproteobacteria bacterium]|nr:PilZ domain-containing protein [Alphaproteobacteria bacterium]